MAYPHLPLRPVLAPRGPDHLPARPPAPAAVNCKADIKQQCSGVDASEEGAVLDCLRKKRNKLYGRCKASS